MRLPLGDVFDKVRNAQKKEEKIEVLRRNASPALWYVLQLAFGKTVWMLPGDAPPYKPWRGAIGSSPNELSRELRRLYLFLEGGNNNLTRLRREKMFQNLLEGLDTNEVELLLSVKDKRLDKVYKCTRKLVEEVFPGLLDAPFSIHFKK